MRQFGIVVMMILVAVGCSFGQTGNAASGNVNGYGMYSIVPLPYGPRAMPGGTSALWTNPAGIGVDGGSGLLFMNSFSMGGDNTTDGFEDDWGIGINLGSLAYGAEVAYEDGLTGIDATRHSMGFSAEFTEGFHFGVAYHWSSGLNRQNSYDMGLLVRPAPWLSVGTQVTEVGRPVINGQWTHPALHLGLAVRPLGPMFTLTADATFWKGKLLGHTDEYKYGDEPDLTFTARVMPVRNIALHGGYALDSETMFAGLTLYGGNAELSSHAANFSDNKNGPDNIGTGWIRLSNEWRPTLLDYVQPKKVVRMKLKGKIIEEPEPYSFFGSKKETLFSVLGRVKRLTEDEHVQGILLEIDDLSSMGFSDRVELREALSDFRDAGKTVVVYARDITLKNYYLASVADRIILHPTGSVKVLGFYANMFYLKNMFDKLGLEAQILQVGKYKSAAEIITRDGMSEPARESLDAVIETLWQRVLEDIADGRNVTKRQVSDWIDEAYFSANEALKAGLVDVIGYDDEAEDKVEELFGDSGIRMVSEKGYFNQKPARDEWEDMTSPKIAVVYATGLITEGKSGREFPFGKSMGSETIAKAIRDARNDKRVKAIVLRIDSGGGSAMASDVILREIERTVDQEIENARHIPVIVSMSDVAASGGYYIACKADTIVAAETCITGSIGVLSGKIVTKGLADKVGISYDSIQRGRNADTRNPTKRWNDEQVGKKQHAIDTIYEQFLDHVAEGRDMDTTRVNELGQGRIWSGSDALERKLVDVNGGFRTAIQIAKHSAGISEEREVEIMTYPCHPMFDIGSDIRAMVIDQLPSSVKEALEAKAFVDAIEQGEPLMICPVNSDAVETE